MSLLSFVHFHDIIRIYGQTFVRIDNNAKQARVGLQGKEKVQKIMKKFEDISALPVSSENVVCQSTAGNLNFTKLNFNRLKGNTRN